MAPPRSRGDTTIARIAVVGGGLAGLAAACALAEEGIEVAIFERRRVLGGRASSFTPPGAPAPLDNCQHIAMGCCTNLRDFCARLGVAECWRFTPEVHFLDRQGRLSVLRRSSLPAPLHTFPSFARLPFLGTRDKLAIASALTAMLREGPLTPPFGHPSPAAAGEGPHAGLPRLLLATNALHSPSPAARERRLEGEGLHSPSPAVRERGSGAEGLYSLSPAARERGPGGEGTLPFSQWLAAHGQTPRAIEAFWRPVLVSALNEEPERTATRCALLVFRDGFLRHPRAYEIGVPTLPLGELYGPPSSAYLERRGGFVYRGQGVRQVLVENGAVAGVELADDSRFPADAVISAVPFHCVAALLPQEGGRPDPPFPALESAPIVGIHLCFDRPVLREEHVSLVDRPIHWVFRHDDCRGKGRCLNLVVSAARQLMPRPRGEIVAMALGELREAFPAVREAKLLRAVVTKNARATFSPTPDSDRLRPGPLTATPGLYLAGDWTQTGWPATMEGAVRSGYRAAEAVLAALAKPKRLLVEDLPVSPLARLFGHW